MSRGGEGPAGAREVSRPAGQPLPALSSPAASRSVSFCKSETLHFETHRSGFRGSAVHFATLHAESLNTHSLNIIAPKRSTSETLNSKTLPFLVLSSGQKGGWDLTMNHEPETLNPKL